MSGPVASVAIKADGSLSYDGGRAHGEGGRGNAACAMGPQPMKGTALRRAAEGPAGGPAGAFETQPA